MEYGEQFTIICQSSHPLDQNANPHIFTLQEVVAKWNQIKATPIPEEAFKTAIDELAQAGDIPKDKLEYWLPLQSREALDQTFARS